METEVPPIPHDILTWIHSIDSAQCPQVIMDFGSLLCWYAVHL
jgi:hypothetical protein